DPIPVVWSHKSDDPNYHIGYVLEAEERPEGLWVKAKIDTDAPTAAQVYRLLKGRRIRQYSFAYDVLKSVPAPKDDSGAQKELHGLKVYEVGPTMIGANQRTNLLAVKHEHRCTCGATPETSAADEAAEKDAPAPAEKAGRVLSKQNEDRVAEIARLATELLDSVRTESTGDGEAVAASSAEKAAPSEPAEPAEPEAAVKAAPGAEEARPAESGVAVERLRSEIELLDL